MLRQMAVWTSAVAMVFSMGVVAQAAQHEQDADQQAAQQHEKEHDYELSKEKFLGKLHIINQKEIEMGELGEEKASSEEVKNMAEQLIQDHQRADEQVMRIAEASDVDLQKMLKAHKDDEKKMKAEMKKKDEDGEKAHKKAELKELSGEEFDRAYSVALAMDHEKTLKLLEKAEEQLQDQEVKSLIEQLEPVIEQHRQRAEELARQHGATDSDFEMAHEHDNH